MDQSEIKRVAETIANHSKMVESLTKSIDFKELARVRALVQEGHERGVQNRIKLDELMEASFAPERRREEREIEMLETLKNIEANTASLGEIVGLIRTNNEKTEEVLELIKEILKISQASNKEEAESMYKQALGKITEFSGGVESVQSLAKVAGDVFNQVVNIF